MVFQRKTSDDKSESAWSMKGLVTRLKKKKKSDLDDFMVIGIDFGTTYSGAAWATVTDFESDQINLISSWPGTGREEGKAPTELFYEDGRVLWGYTIPSDADPIRWFKLLLLREEDLAPELRGSEFILRGRRMLRESGKTAVDFVADYLRALWGHILETIQKARGKAVVEALSFHIVITVPAIWKDYARSAMEEAAVKSGILSDRPAGPSTLAFAPEPEAAALSSLCEGGRAIKSGDVYVICDAGGGTVDLISYKIGDMDPIALHEAVVGSGGLCGGVFIDEAFESMCKARLGRRWNKLTQTGIKGIMKNEWEYSIKPQFKLDNNLVNEYRVAIPAEAFEGSDLNDESRKPIIKGGRIHFASSDIQQVFASSFKGIDDLVDGQINQVKKRSLSVTGIILVGGLGSSPYLYEHLKKKYGGKKIDVYQSGGIRPRTAICRGAIFKGFLDGPSVGQNNRQPLNVASPVTVVSTIARMSLGVRYEAHFEEGKHSEKSKVWDEVEGEYFAANQMKWYLRKGDNVSKMEPRKETFYTAYSDRNEFRQTKTETIYACEDDEPPQEHNRTQIGGSTIKELCRFECRIDVRYEDLEGFTAANGRSLKRFLYDLEMVPSGASNEFKVLYKGEELASQDVRVDFK